MADSKELPVLGWLIKHSYLGPHTVWCGHNSVGDYRDADPDATSTELTSLPAATAALSELRAEANRLSAMLDHRNDEAAETERMLRAEVERLRVRADRYDWLRRKVSMSRTVFDGYTGPWCFAFPPIVLADAPDTANAALSLDAAIDTARSAASGESAEE